MKLFHFFPFFRRLRSIWVPLLGLLTGGAAHAGLTLSMQLVHYNSGDNRFYYFFPVLNTNSTAPNVSFGTYYITSPGYPTNGATALYQFDASGFNLIGGGARRVQRV